MSKLGKALTIIEFGRQLIGPMREFLKALYTRTGGDVVQAAKILRRIPDHWSDYDQQVAEINAEFEKLKAEGK